MRSPAILGEQIVNEYIFKKKLTYRFSAYLLLLPFIPAMRPLLDRHNRVELILFLSGFILTILLIIYSNSRAYIRIAENRLFIFLIYRHKPEIHHKTSITKIIEKTSGKLIINTEGFEPLEIRLNKKEQKRFIEIMEDWQIPVSKAYRSS